MLTASTTSTASRASTPAPPLLPGEQTWSDGAASYDFGTNDTIDYASPNVDTPDSSTFHVQGDIKAGGLTMTRVWSYAGDTQAYVMSKVQATVNDGTTCYFMLGETENLAWQETTIGWVKNYCHIFEFGNEPDDGANHDNSNIATYTQQWIADIPKLRALDPGAVFGGPALSSAFAQSAGEGSYVNDMQYFLATTKAAGVLPDFISYHDYPCWEMTSQSACITHAVAQMAADQSDTVAAEQEYLGKVLPTGNSEYNFDPGSQTLYNWCNDGTFMNNWTTAVINGFVADGYSFALQFDSMNWGGYGCFDMFSDAAPYGPKPQFEAMASEVQKYRTDSTQILIPSNGASLKGTAVLDALAGGPRTVTGVSFDLSGGSLTKPVVVGTGVATLYGWIARWNTKTVANGTYSLQSVATETGGTTATSSKITVTVKN